jgi:hypothetical protein
MNWQPIESAPKDRPILGWCVHDADPYFAGETSDGRSYLTTYGGHCEGMSHVEDGPHVLVWGGAYDDSTWEYPSQSGLPDWWFRHGSEFEEAANPIYWMEIPETPK